MKKILLLGKNGQVGFELSRALQPLGHVLALDRNTYEGFCGDVANFDAINFVITKYRPDVIVNASAYTNVDKAQTDKEACDFINHLAVANLAKCAKKTHALLIHYSTDYVFDGTGDTPWQENDDTKPINYYGICKKNGELALQDSGCQFINIRTSWVYGIYGNNFLKTMLKLGQERQSLSVIDDQIGSPTPAFLIADTTAHIIAQYFLTQDKQALLGHYHLSPNGHCSWYEYAKFIFEKSCALGIRLKINELHKIASDQYPTCAKRPLNSRLNTNKICQNFHLNLPNWQMGVEYTLKILAQNQFLIDNLSKGAKQ